MLGLALGLGANQSTGGGPPVGPLNLIRTQGQWATGNAADAETTTGYSFPRTKATLNATNFAFIRSFYTTVAMSSIQMGGAAVCLADPSGGVLEANYPNSFIPQLAVDFLDGGGQRTTIPITFAGGQSSLQINPGDRWICDNIPSVDHTGAPYTIPAGTLCNLRGYISFPGGIAGQIITRLATINGNVAPMPTEWSVYNATASASNILTNPGNAYNTVAQVGGTGLTGSTGAWFPDWISGNHVDAATSVLVLGNSISQFNAETQTVIDNLMLALGWPNRLAALLNVAQISYGKQGRQLNDLLTETGTYEFSELIKHFNYTWIELNINDFLIGNQSLAAMKTILATVAQRINAINPYNRIVVFVPLPYVDSTSDGMATVANQTISSAGALAAVAYRAWLRSTALSDLAGLGANIWAVHDPGGTPYVLGAGPSAHATQVEYYNAGTPTGKWNVDTAPIYTGACTAAGSTSTFFDSAIRATGVNGYQDLMGSTITWSGNVTAALAGLSYQLLQVSGSGSGLKAGSTMAAAPQIGDTYTVTYKTVSNSSPYVHPPTPGHILASETLFHTVTYPPFTVPGEQPR